METVIRIEGATAICCLFGELEAFSASQLRQVMAALTVHRHVVLDLGGVSFIDSAGLGVIMNYFVSAQSHGRKFFLTGVSDRIRALFEMARVDNVLNVCESVEAAEALS